MLLYHILIFLSLFLLGTKADNDHGKKLNEYNIWFLLSLEKNLQNTSYIKMQWRRKSSKRSNRKKAKTISKVVFSQNDLQAEAKTKHNGNYSHLAVDVINLRNVIAGQIYQLAQVFIVVLIQRLVNT